MSSKPRLVDLRGGRRTPPPSPGDIRPREPRRSQLKIRRQRTRAVISAAISVCALLTIYSVHVASYLPRFTYSHVSVVGAQSVAPGDIEAFVENKLAESSRGFISGRNIFIYNYAPLSSEIVNNFPAIRNVTVTRDTSMGNGLVINVEERRPFAQWCEAVQSGSCFILDEQGIIFSPASGISTSSTPSAFIFAGELSTSTVAVKAPPYGEVFAGEHFAGIVALLKLLQSIGLSPQGATIVSDTDFSVPLAEGFYLKASFGEDPETLAKNLTLILNADALKGKLQLLEYIDMRFGNRVYYKFKGQPESK